MEEFLDAIFANAVSSDLRIAVFTLPENRPRFFGSISETAQAAEKLSHTQNVYFGVGLIRGAPSGRGKEKDVACIGSFWADVDYVSDAHPNKALPRDDDDLKRLIDQMPFPPSIIVDSGNGRHLYWLIQETWVFANDEERNRAATIAKGWHGLVCTTANRLGWSLENLGDLPRILRLPDTINRKNADHPMNVRIVESNTSLRYAIEDFENYLPTEVKLSNPPSVQRNGNHHSVDLDGKIPIEKFESAIHESPLFSQTWERCRPDLADQSASAYDLSLATIAAMRGWTDLEIGNLLFAWRTKHDEKPEKAQRVDYLNRTITRARAAAASENEQEVDLTYFTVPAAQPEAEDVPQTPDYPDPGPTPEALLRVPGFISELMDHCLTTAPYPNVALAFGGAIVLQSFLAGRKVRDPGDNRTNLYVLGLAHSGAGKDWPRKINTEIIHQIGLGNSLGERFSSGEGLQDALYTNPCMLFQADEIDDLLQSINKARDNRFGSIMSTLLTMYSSASSVYPMRCKAGREDAAGAIVQPCLSLFGTAIPNHYYAALSERMLTNGLFARMLILESSRRGTGQEPGIRTVPARIIETAAWWAKFQPDTGNLQSSFPVPQTVEQTEQARQVLVDARIFAEEQYQKSEEENDAVGTTVWARVSEQSRKLALIYAISANYREPTIDTSAAQWAVDLVFHQVKRMLFMASGYVAENPFHGDCLKLIQKLRAAPNQTLTHSVLLKRMKVDTKTFRTMIETLDAQGDIGIEPIRTAGRTGYRYRLKIRGMFHLT